MSNTDNTSLIAARGWKDVALRSLMAAVISFVALNTKEYLSAGSFDHAGCGVDGAIIGGFTFAVYAILAFVSPPARRSTGRVPVAAAR